MNDHELLQDAWQPKNEQSYIGQGQKMTRSLSRSLFMCCCACCRRFDCPAVVIMIVTTTVCVFTDDIIGWYCRELRLLLSPFNFNFVVAVFWDCNYDYLRLWIWLYSRMWSLVDIYFCVPIFVIWCCLDVPVIRIMVAIVIIYLQRVLLLSDIVVWYHCLRLVILITRRKREKWMVWPHTNRNIDNSVASLSHSCKA